MNSKHAIVISYDAFSEDNWEIAKGLPNLSKLIKSGAVSTKLRSVYPTLTYTVHTTMMTGVYPDKHGVFHNNPFQPFVEEKDQNWFWYRDAIRVPTLYDLAKKKGLSTAGLLWPVSGKSSIRYNLPEIHALKGENQSLKVLKGGSPLFCLELELKYGRYRKGVKQPYLDDFTTLCAVDTIKRKKPNLLLAHLIDLDDAKHHFGTDSKEVKEAILRMDVRLGKIIKAIEDAGTKEDTTLFVIGDHGQLNVRYKVALNHLFKEKGLIFEENGEMNWRAYLQSTGGAAYLHIKEGDVEAEKLALDILKDAIDSGNYGIEHIYSREKLDSLRVNKSVTTMIEAKPGYCFVDSLKVPIVVDLEEEGIQYATHGYSPHKENYKCVFMASGPHIKKDYSLENIEMVDVAPTIGKTLGIELENCDGRVLEEIFR